MASDLQLISDGDGVAVIGDTSAVEEFLVARGLTSKDLGLPRLASLLGTGSELAYAASGIGAASGRWVQLTEASTKLIDTYGLMKSTTSGLNLGVVQEKGGTIKGIVEFANGRGQMLANPAVLAGAAGIMAQLAMQQAMDDTTEYLAVIDEKVDDVLRAQKDAALADMIGVGFVIEEAMTLRTQVGSVSEVTWSKVQATSLTIARTQAYALRQLDALAEKLERKTNVVELAGASKSAASTVQEWLVVLARCFQLQDAMAVLELDRVLTAAPDELHRHRIALRIARQNRLELIARSTERLMIRIDETAGSANTKVLLHPFASPAVVRSSNHAGAAIGDFHERLGIERDRQLLEARPWMDAASEMRDRVFDSGADGIDAARRFGGETVDRGRSVAGKVSDGIAERVRRVRGDDPDQSGREGGR